MSYSRVLGAHLRRMRAQRSRPIPVEPDEPEGITPEAKWARVYRRRVREGVACVLVELGPDDLDLLVSSGCLDGGRNYRREEAAAALQRFLRLSRQA